MVDEFRGDTEWPLKDERFDLSSFSDGTFVMVEVNRLSSNVFGKRFLCSVSSTSTATTASSLSPQFRRKQTEIGKFMVLKSDKDNYSKLSTLLQEINDACTSLTRIFMHFNLRHC